MTDPDRYARQRLIQWWDQDRLCAGRVLVAGVGALGNEVLKNLALLGVGRILAVDFDHVEASNLSRTVLFTAADVGRAKVVAAAEACHRINPGVDVRVIQGDVRHDVGLGHDRHSDLVIGCLDNLAARSHVGLCCVLAGAPYLDGGMWSLGGEVRWFTPGDGPCFDCMLTSADRRREDQRYSCTGLQHAAAEQTPAVPTVATTASIIGGLLGQEAAKWLCGQPVLEGRAIVFDGQQQRMHRAALARNPACPCSHQPYYPVQELPWSVKNTTARQLLARAAADRDQSGSLAHGAGAACPVLELGRDWLAALACPVCGRRQEIRRRLGSVLTSEQICADCGTERHTEVFCALDETSRFLDLQLSELGIPPAEVLAVRTSEQLSFYEMTADVDRQPRAEHEGPELGSADT